MFRSFAFFDKDYISKLLMSGLFPSMVDFDAPSVHPPSSSWSGALALQLVVWTTCCRRLQIPGSLSWNEVAPQLDFFGEPMADLPAVDLKDHLHPRRAVSQAVR